MPKPKDIDVGYVLANFKLVDGTLCRLDKRRGWRVVNVNCVSPAGYTYVGIPGRVVLLHRLLWVLYHKTNPTILDHINGDTSDNRKENLREVTSRENSQNKKCHRDGSLPGANWLPTAQKWVSGITRDGVSVYLGSYTTEQEAHKLYLLAVEHLSAYTSPGQFREYIRQLAGYKGRTKYMHRELKGTYQRGRKWQGRIYIQGKMCYLGTYTTEQEAHQAYMQALSLRTPTITPEEFKAQWKLIKTQHTECLTNQNG